MKPAMLGHHGVQLGVDVAPFAHAADVDEVLAQQLLPLAVADFVRGFFDLFGGIEQRQPLFDRAFHLRTAGALSSGALSSPVTIATFDITNDQLKAGGKLVELTMNVEPN